jgi:DNA-directed RNA polymerase
MYQWDKYTEQQRDRLRNLQVAREDQWKEDMLVKFQQTSPDNLTPFNDVVDEHAKWFAEAVTKYLEQVLDDSESRSRMPAWIYQVWNLGPDRLAYIVVRSAMESIYSSVLTKDDSPQQNIWALPTAQVLGRDIADKCWDVAAWLAARNAEPFYYREQSKYFKNWQDKRRRAFTKKVNAMPKATMREKDNFGHAMVRLGIDSGLLEKKNIYEKKISSGKTKMSEKVYVTLPSDMITYMMSKIDEYAARLLPNRLPMVCRPVTHTPDENGGMMDWSLRKMRSTTRLKARPEADTLEENREVDPSCMSDMTRNVINTLQNTEWKVNAQVLEVMRDLWKSGRETGTVPSYDQGQTLEMSEYPEHGSKTEKHEWMDEKSRRWAKWAKNEAARLQMSLRMHEAYKLKPFVLWHAYFCDFRGRYYSDSYLMHPQGADLDKSLLMAAEPVDVQPRDIYWIKVNLSNLMGVDKVSFDDRAKYVDDHMDDWRAVTADPHGTTELWEDDAPKKNASFQRLAAIFDLIMAIDEGKSQVPVQLDGACNGIQHWAAMTRDENIGPQVNLTPTDKPNDVYQLVADGCTDLCATQPNDWRNRFLQHYAGMIPRKVVKRSVMCDPYGISDHSVRQYVLQEKHLDWVLKLSLNIHQAANEMGQLIIASKDVQMEHCNHGKKYVQLLCGWVGGEVDKPMQWVSPSGFLVINKYNPRAEKRSAISLWDKQFKLNFGYYTDEYDCDQALTAMPPNWVHSLDAAHMSLCVDDLSSKGIEFFSMIHDSYGVMAPYVPMLRDSIKETFHAIHKTDQLEYIKECAEGIVGQSLPEQHPARKHEQRGCLDIDACLDADYLFG